MEKDNKLNYESLSKNPIDQLLAYCSHEKLPYTAEEIHSILAQKNNLLNETNRLEFSDQSQKQLLYNLAKSPYFDFTEKLRQSLALQRLYYYFRAEISSFIVTDDELINQLFYYYNHECHGYSQSVEVSMEEWVQVKKEE